MASATIKAVGGLKDDVSPAPVKKLSLREVARRFEAGEDGVLEDYRERNLGESSDLLQRTLASMPRGKTLVKELIQLAQELQGRVAGRNSDDAAQMKAGLQELQAQWKQLEQSTKQAAKELSEQAVVVTGASRQEPDQGAHLHNRIEQLEEDCAQLRTQVTDQDAIIKHLQHELEAERQKTKLASKGGGASPAQSPAAPAAVEEAASLAVSSLSIDGSPAVGHTLQVAGSGGAAPGDSVPLQWLRQQPGNAAPYAISGAVRPQYSPEVADVGCVMLCRVGADTEPASNVLKMETPITVEPGLDEEAARLEAEGGASFFVVPVQHNGQVQRKRTVATLRVDGDGLSLKVADAEVASANYHTDMQVCGARGGGDGAAQGMFLALSPQHVFMLALETPWKRNVCISLVRKMAKRRDLELELEGPRESA